MEKNDILEKLSQILNFETEYRNEKGETGKLCIDDIPAILNAYGIKVEDKEKIDEIILDLELEPYKNIVPKVKITEITQQPFIEINIKKEEINKTYYWVIEKENGIKDGGKFIASKLNLLSIKTLNNDITYYQYRFNIPIHLELGYHNFKIVDNTFDHISATIIVVPEKCFIPKVIQENKDILGLKFTLSDYCAEYENEINNIKNLIKKISEYDIDLIDIGPINQAFVDEKNNYNPYSPSSRMFFNIYILNIDEMLNFIDDKELQVRFLSREFTPIFETREDNKQKDYKTIFDYKFKKYKLIYESFRKNHIAKKTNKSQEFYTFIRKYGKKLHKLALFNALRDTLSADTKSTNWTKWPNPYQETLNETLIQFQKNNNELIEFYKFLYWQADIQFKEASEIANKNNISIGISTDFSLCINKNSAENWMNKEYFSEDVKIKIDTENKTEQTYCMALNPYKLTDSSYSYFIDLIKQNMKYSGVLNLSNIDYFMNSKWELTTNDAKKIFKVKYPIEDLLRIIALESQKAKCMVTYQSEYINENSKNLLNKYGLYNKNIFNLREINGEADLNKYYAELELRKKSQGKLPAEILANALKIPNSTYRFQFNKDFIFNDAKEQIPHLKKLGISHVYSSPILSSRAGSLHGYDVIKHDEINTEIGTEEEFESFIDELHRNGMGLILDIVPNHMCIGKENKWWMDVLENGQASIYANYFDIDWNPIKKELKGKILIPVLGDQYGNILSSGQISLSFNEKAGKISANYYEHEFPLDPSTYPIILNHRLDVLKTRLGSEHKDFLEYLSIITVFNNLPKHTNTDSDKIAERNREKYLASNRLALLYMQNYIIKGFIDENLIDFKCSADNEISIQRTHNLLEAQSYRLAYWRVSADEINYRRFFDINDLAAICLEEQEVFISTHALILKLIDDRKIDGLRIDHPDGLLEPAIYYQRLQHEIAKRIGVEFNPKEEKLLSAENLPFYIIAEKILSQVEQLQTNWAIHGTVGYDFLNVVNNLFIDSAKVNEFTNLYHAFIGYDVNYEDLAIESKKLIINTSLSAELNVLANHLNQISEMYLFTRDYTLNSIKNALTEIIACFPVYRTYISLNEETDRCENFIKWAIGLAKRRSQTTDISIYDFIEKVLLLELESDKDSDKYKAILRFTMKFQQYTGPLMAKGFEDTFFYRYNRLIALNEVGGYPDKFGFSVEEFHQNNLNRAEIMPNSMLSTSTHDTKRSEDVRCRICAITEFFDEWQELVNTLHQINKSGSMAPDKTIDPNDEYLIYQSLVGIFLTEDMENEDNYKILEDRLEKYILKAAKESKVHTSWININSEYEQMLSDFVKRIMGYPQNHPFWKHFLSFYNLIANIGFINSISQCVIKLTSPGVPDIYQGCEIYKFNLVDPDNRHPIDYKKIKEAFEAIQTLINFNPEKDSYDIFEKTLIPIESSKIKLLYSNSILQFRNQHQNLFKKGKYIPLKILGKNSDHFFAYARLIENEAIIVITPRLLRSILKEENPIQIDPEAINHTIISIPEELLGFQWKDIITKKVKTIDKDTILLADILDILPVTILYGEK